MENLSFKTECCLLTDATTKASYVGRSDVVPKTTFVIREEALLLPAGRIRSNFVVETAHKSQSTRAISNPPATKTRERSIESDLRHQNIPVSG